MLTPSPDGLPEFQMPPPPSPQQVATVLTVGLILRAIVVIIVAF